MALRIWLKKSIKSSPLFEQGKSGAYFFEDTIFVRVCPSSGKFYLHLDDLWAEQPTGNIESFFDYFSYQETFGLKESRCVGWYQKDSADAWLDFKDEKYHLHIKAPLLKDIINLYSSIRSGRIAPSDSWENPQITADQEGQEENVPPTPPVGESSDLSTPSNEP